MLAKVGFDLGTNGIQALDLVGRKFRMQDGRPVKDLLRLAGDTAQSLGVDPVLGASARQLAEAVKVLGAVLTELPARGNATLLMLLNAVPILDMLGHVVGGHLLLQQAHLAQQKALTLMAERGVDPNDPGAVRALQSSSRDAAFYQNKVQAAIHFAHRGLPLVAAQAVALLSGETAPMDAVF